MYGVNMNNPGQNDINAIIQRNYSVDIGGYLNRGWEIFQGNIGGFIGFMVVTFLINIVLAFIPFIGSIASVVIGGPLQAGNYIVAFKIGKQQPTEFGDFFKGFQNAYFLPIFLATLVISILAGLCFAPAMIVIFLAAATADVSGEAGLGIFSVVGPLGLLLMLVGIVVAIFISIAYLFSIPLIVGKRMQFWPAMEASRKIVSKQWLGFFLFLIVLGIINMIGAALCFIGLLFTAPLSACAIAAAYESIVGLPTFDPSQA